MFDLIPIFVLFVGGSMSECLYVDGVVFQKTVSHKKMMLTELSRRDDNHDINKVSR